MKVKLVFLEGLENFFGVKPECSDLYFCASTDGNNKTSHLLKHLMGNLGSWVSTEDELGGTITLERWLDVEGEVEEWLIKKVKEFEFLIEYNKPDVSLYGHNGTDS